MFAQRDAGVIVGLYNCLQPGVAEEQIASDHPEVLAFLNPAAPTALQLEAFCKAALDGTSGNVNVFKLVKALAIDREAYRLGKAPGALTGAELAALRDRIAAIYKAL